MSTVDVVFLLGVGRGREGALLLRYLPGDSFVTAVGVQVVDFLGKDRDGNPHRARVMTVATVDNAEEAQRSFTLPKYEPKALAQAYALRVLTQLARERGLDAALSRHVDEYQDRCEGLR